MMIIKTIIIYLSPILLFYIMNKTDTGKGGVQTIDNSVDRISVSQANKEFEKAWRIFVNAVLADDFKKTKQLSTNCIDCSICVTNTPEEAAVYDEYWSSHQYFKKIDSAKFVSIDKFIREDLKIIFDSTLKSRLKVESKVIFHDYGIVNRTYNERCIISSSDFKKSKLQEAIVSVIDPSPEFEGFQKAFDFILTKQGYKFCGYSTIP
jgi:hypothetical protein